MARYVKKAKEEQSPGKQAIEITERGFTYVKDITYKNLKSDETRPFVIYCANILAGALTSSANVAVGFIAGIEKLCELAYPKLSTNPYLRLGKTGVAIIYGINSVLDCINGDIGSALFDASIAAGLGIDSVRHNGRWTFGKSLEDKIKL